MDPEKNIEEVIDTFDDSGEGQWRGGLSGHGRKDLRALLIEAAHSILRSSGPQARWGKKLMARKGSKNVAVAALARKLAVSAWYVLKGLVEPLERVDRKLSVKLDKIVSAVGSRAIVERQTNRRDLKAAAEKALTSGRIYELTPHIVFRAKAKLEPATA